MNAFFRRPVESSLDDSFFAREKPRRNGREMDFDFRCCTAAATPSLHTTAQTAPTRLGLRKHGLPYSIFMSFFQAHGEQKKIKPSDAGFEGTTSPIRGVKTSAGKTHCLLLLLPVVLWQQTDDDSGGNWKRKKSVVEATKKIRAMPRIKKELGASGSYRDMSLLCPSSHFRPV